MGPKVSASAKDEMLDLAAHETVALVGESLVLVAEDRCPVAVLVEFDVVELDEPFRDAFYCFDAVHIGSS